MSCRLQGDIPYTWAMNKASGPRGLQPSKGGLEGALHLNLAQWHSDPFTSLNGNIRVDSLFWSSLWLSGIKGGGGRDWLWMCPEVSWLSSELCQVCLKLKRAQNVNSWGGATWGLLDQPLPMLQNEVTQLWDLLSQRWLSLQVPVTSAARDTKRLNSVSIDPSSTPPSFLFPLQLPPKSRFLRPCLPSTEMPTGSTVFWSCAYASPLRGPVPI